MVCYRRTLVPMETQPKIEDLSPSKKVKVSGSKNLMGIVFHCFPSFNGHQKHYICVLTSIIIGLWYQSESSRNRQHASPFVLKASGSHALQMGVHVHVKNERGACAIRTNNKKIGRCSAVGATCTARPLSIQPACSWQLAKWRASRSRSQPTTSTVASKHTNYLQIQIHPVRWTDFESLSSQLPGSFSDAPSLQC